MRWSTRMAEAMLKLRGCLPLQATSIPSWEFHVRRDQGRLHPKVWESSESSHTQISCDPPGHAKEIADLNCKLFRISLVMRKVVYCERTL